MARAEVPGARLLNQLLLRELHKLVAQFVERSLVGDRFDLFAGIFKRARLQFIGLGRRRRFEDAAQGFGGVVDRELQVVKRMTEEQQRLDENWIFH